jgi:hypothetical protein
MLGEQGDPAAVWRAASLRGPHIRDAMARLGLVHETFETAIIWDRFREFDEPCWLRCRRPSAMPRAALTSSKDSPICCPLMVDQSGSSIIVSTSSEWPRRPPQRAFGSN